MITETEYKVWATDFIRRFISPYSADDPSYIKDWFRKLDQFNIADLRFALDELMADPRIMSKAPRTYLPIILEYAEESMTRRQNLESLKAKLAESRQFDQARVDDGRMTKEEFDKKWTRIPSPSAKR